jgi:hypothetical protein
MKGSVREANPAEYQREKEGRMCKLESQVQGNLNMEGTKEEFFEEEDSCKAYEEEDSAGTDALDGVTGQRHRRNDENCEMSEDYKHVRNDGKLHPDSDDSLDQHNEGDPPFTGYTAETVEDNGQESEKLTETRGSEVTCFEKCRP